MHADPNSPNPSATPSALHAETCSIFDMECCPLCGGASGFTYRLTLRGTQFRSWNGANDEFTEDGTGQHGAYRCDDCGKIIKSNVKEHAPLSARANVDNAVEVETTEKHANRAADRGCCVSAHKIAFSPKRL